MNQEVSTQKDSDQSITNCQEKIDQLLTGYSSRQEFSGNILIATKGNIHFVKSYGYSNYENSTPNNPKTIFGLASITKWITACRVLQLEDQGKISFSDPLSIYFPLTTGKIIGTVTIAQILTHSSGIEDFIRMEYETKEDVSLQEFSRTLSQATVKHFPGSQINYGNSPFVILSYIIEIVTDTNFNDGIEEYIFKPLAMYDSFMYNGLPQPKGHLAQPYERTGEAIIPAPFINLKSFRGACGAYSTLLDLYKFAEGLNSNLLFSEKQKLKMFNDYKTGFGYGCNVDTKQFKKSENECLVYKKGGMTGWSGMLSIVPVKEKVIILLCNYWISNIGDITNHILGLSEEA